MRRPGAGPSALLLAGLALSRPLGLAAQEAAAFGLPNGLEVRSLHLANTGTVRARLVFSIREGEGGAPEGTAHTMSRVLPLLGAGGADRAAFEALKDQSGVLSRVDAGLGWISWTFESLPANAEMMIQLLADESLRPAWSRSDGLPGMLARVWEESQSGEAGEDAARSFRAAAGDPAAGPLPQAPMGQDEFVALWAAAVRRPERAVLSVVGDVESIPLRRTVSQHFGPWGGPDANAEAAGRRGAARAKERPARRVVSHGASAPEVWVAWDLGALPPHEAEALAALVPWLLKTAPPAPGGAVRDLEIDPGGRWARAAGRRGAPHGPLESHLRETLAAPLTQARLDAALAARGEYEAAGALHPQRTLERLGAPAGPGSGAPPPAPQLDELRTMLEKCMEPGNLEVLVLAPLDADVAYRGNH